MRTYYVFFVQIGKEQDACKLLNKLLNDKVSRAFVPKVKLTFKNSKYTGKFLKPMFPGYVFMKSLINTDEFIEDVIRIVRFSTCIYYILNSNESKYICLNEEEKKNLLKFCDDTYIVEESSGYISGDQVIITSGPLMGNECVIRKVNRHKKIAEIEMEFLGELRSIKVALEIVEKVVRNL